MFGLKALLAYILDSAAGIAFWGLLGVQGAYFFFLTAFETLELS